MSLSVCCLTSDPGPRIAGSLGQLREAVDEIVVVADARVGEEDLAAYAAVADRLLRIEFDFLERHLAWLHAQCAGDWVLRLDGDEVVSPALIAELPDLTVSRSVLQYWVPRRWLYPDADHWLCEPPWFPDMQLRLVRNDATLRFPGQLHTSALPAWPAGYVESPIYHLACLLEDRDERCARALRYELRAPGKRAPGGGKANDVFYVPEDYACLAPEPVPEEDRSAIAAALAGAPSTSPSPLVPLVEAAIVDARWAGRGVEPADRRASIELVDGSLHRGFETGERRDLLVRVRNEGRVTWPWGDGQPPEIRLAHRWLRLSGEQAGPEWPRQRFARDVAAGERVLLPVDVTAPDAPGRYTLHLDLVHEHVAWFGADLYAEFEVAPRPPVPRTVRPTRAWRRRRRPRPIVIPRVIHRVWLGDAPLPEEACRFGEGWELKNPGWELRLWTDAHLHDLFPDRSALDRARSPSEASDLTRFEVLRRFGGLYVDTDVECLRPIEPLLRGVRAFAGEELPGRLGTAVIGAVAGHRLIERAVGASRDTVGRVAYPESTGPGLFTALAEDDADLLRFAREVFYPYLWDEPSRRGQRFRGAYAVHHWARTWEPDEET